MTDLVLSIIMLAGMVLLGGAWSLHRKGDAKRAMLMLILALVMFANVAIWLVPTGAGGDTLQDAAADE